MRAAPTAAPRTWQMVYRKALMKLTLPAMKKPSDTAGLR